MKIEVETLARETIAAALEAHYEDLNRSAWAARQLGALVVEARRCGDQATVEAVWAVKHTLGVWDGPLVVAIRNAEGR